MRPLTIVLYEEQRPTSYKIQPNATNLISDTMLKQAYQKPKELTAAKNT